MPQVSIIIPVYNAQRDLARCLDSLLTQDFQDWEAILVNDGSKDNSGDIIDQYCAADKRFHAIHQKNGGPGAARNAGLHMARGEFLQFVDSDDMIPKNSTADLLEGTENHDLTIAHFVIIDGERHYSRGLVKRRLSADRRHFLHLLIQWPGSYYYSALWNKLYRRSIVEKMGLRFQEDFIWGEDCLFNMSYYRAVDSVQYKPAEVYHYDRRVSGLSWGSLFKLHKGIRIKAMIYHALKRLYVDAKLYYRYWLRVQLYIFNITLMH